jgi:hypothetical protein
LRFNTNNIVFDEHDDDQDEDSEADKLNGTADDTCEDKSDKPVNGKIRALSSSNVARWHSTHDYVVSLLVCREALTYVVNTEDWPLSGQHSYECTRIYLPSNHVRNSSLV